MNRLSKVLCLSVSLCAFAISGLFSAEGDDDRLSRRGGVAPWGLGYQQEDKSSRLLRCRKAAKKTVREEMAELANEHFGLEWYEYKDEKGNKTQCSRESDPEGAKNLENALVSYIQTGKVADNSIVKDYVDNAAVEDCRGLYKSAINAGKFGPEALNAIGRSLSGRSEFQVDLSGSVFGGIAKAVAISGLERALKPVATRIETASETTLSAMFKSLRRFWIRLMRGDVIEVGSNDVGLWWQSVSDMVEPLLTTAREAEGKELANRGWNKRVMDLDDVGAEGAEDAVKKDEVWESVRLLYIGSLDAVQCGIENCKRFYAQDVQVCSIANLLGMAVFNLRKVIEDAQSFNSFFDPAVIRNIKLLKVNVNRLCKDLSRVMDVKSGEPSKDGSLGSSSARSGYGRTSGMGGYSGAGGYDI